jgi:hypothetical protein
MTNGANELGREDRWVKERAWTLWALQAAASVLTGAGWLLKILGRIH